MLPAVAGVGRVEQFRLEAALQVLGALVEHRPQPGLIDAVVEDQERHHGPRIGIPVARNRAVDAAMAAVRATLGVVLLAIPAFGQASLVIGIRSLGWSAGRTRAIRGHHSTLYVPPGTAAAVDRGQILELPRQPSQATSRAA